MMTPTLFRHRLAESRSARLSWRSSGFLFLAGLVLAANSMRAEDWPTYMHDSGRSGVSGETLALPLTERWKYMPPARPTPAWPTPQAGRSELPQLNFDAATHAVLAGDAVYFSSAVDNSIQAWDAGTGRRRWRFFTDAPVRLAPTVAGEWLYAGSDDGYVYCLNRAEGTLRWKTKPFSGARRILGAERLMSMWPVRTGVLVIGDAVYCGAGVFPYHGTAVVCLAAATGEVRWLEQGGKKIEKQRTPVPIPQGYLVASDTHLWVPCGRTAPQVYSLLDGSFVGAPKTSTKDVSGSFGMLVPKRPAAPPSGEALFYSGSQNTLYGCAATGQVRAVLRETAQVLATPETLYRLGNALARKRGTAAMQVLPATVLQAVDREMLAAQPKRGIPEEGVKWTFKGRNLRTMIRAGGHLYVGGKDEVLALDAATGKEVWRAGVDGLVLSLAAANGRLAVSTDAGNIHCFGAGPVGVVASGPAAPPKAVKKAPTTAETLAAAIARDAQLDRGYAVVVGRDSTALAAALAERTEMQVHALVADAEEAAAAREMFAADGRYGTRIVVDVAPAGPEPSLPYPPYFANLVVRRGAARADEGESLLSPAALLRILKPCGGRLYYQSGADGGEVGVAQRAWREAGKVAADLRLDGSPGVWERLTRGPLKGAGQWTHQYGDAANRGASRDTLVAGKLGVLWYGPPGPGVMQDRHSRTQAPLVVDGRVYVQGILTRNNQTVVLCFDAYNGVLHWERAVPGAKRLAVSNNCGNLAASSAGLFLATGDRVLQLHPEDGRTVRTYSLPPARDGASQRTWAFVAVVGSTLVGSASPSYAFSEELFAYDVAAGDLKWRYPASVIRNATLVVSDGRVMFAEHRGETAAPKVLSYEELLQLTVKQRRGLKQAKRTKGDEDRRRTVVALDLATGREQWAVPVDLAGCGSWGGNLSAAAGTGVLAFFGTYTAYGRAKGNEGARRVVALAVADGKQLWSELFANRVRPVIVGDQLISRPQARSLTTGQPVMHETRKGLRPWTLPTNGACGQMSASETLLFYRLGVTVARPIPPGSGGMHFPGMRPGCLINIIPAAGVVVQVEGSSGCTCAAAALQSTLVFAPATAWQ